MSERPADPPPPAVDDAVLDALVAAAAEARDNAYAPYSGFAVGAAVLMEDGEIYRGCNVENHTYSLTVCAERTAVLSAVAAGAGRVVAAAVVAPASPPSRPCGPCLQVLTEHAAGDGDTPLVLANPEGERDRVTLRQLLPQPFALPAERR